MVLGVFTHAVTFDQPANSNLNDPMKNPFLQKDISDIETEGVNTT